MKEKDLRLVAITKRQIEIVKLLADGFSNKEIGEKLFISESTVKTFRKQMILDLRVKNSLELISFVIRNGYID